MDKKNFTKTGDIDGRSRLGRSGIRSFAISTISSLPLLLLGVLAISIIWLGVSSITSSHIIAIVSLTIFLGIFIGPVAALMVALGFYALAAVILGFIIIIGYLVSIF